MAVRGAESEDKETQREAFAAAMAACKVIDENDLLDDDEAAAVGGEGLESLINDDRIQAVKSIYKKIADPDFISSAKELVKAFSGGRRRRRG